MMVLRTVTRSMSLQRCSQPRHGRNMKPTHKSLIIWHMLIVCYYFYTSICCSALVIDESRFQDLSYTFDDTTIYWVTQKKLNFTVIHNGTDPTGSYWYQSDEISAGTHGGTHMDSPCHFAVGRWCISDIPLQHLVVPTVVVDISHDVGDNPDVHLSSQHMIKWEEMHGKIPDSSLLLIRTGWSRFWPDPLKYTGTLEKNASLLKYPSIKSEVAKWLVENRHIVGIGIDTMSIDKPNSDRGTHTTLMEKNIYGLENVKMIEPLPPTGLRAYVMPMKLRNSSGAPCRVLVEILKDSATNGNIGNGNGISLIWINAVLVALWIFG